MSWLDARSWLAAAALGWMAIAGWACNDGGGATDGGTEGGPADATIDVVIPSEAGATLTGDQAFPVVFTWMDTAMPKNECSGKNQTPDGGLAATAIVLAEEDLTALACGDAGGAGAQGRLVEIGIATPAWVADQTAPQTQALAPGSYTVGDQKVPDEDFCMIPSGDTAWFQVLQVDDAGTPFATWNGVSGTIDVTSVTSNSVAGSFAVQLGDPNGGTADGGSLSGKFSAATCGP